MKLARVLIGAALAVAAFVSVPAFAQPAGAVQSVAPLSRDLPSALITFASTVPSTVNSADQTGYNVSRIICVMRQTSQVGSTSTTFAIQGKDKPSGQYYALVTSAAYATASLNGVSPIALGAGLTDSANVRVAMPVPAIWRVSATVTGGTAVGIGTIGCTVQ